jgi:hypothetical protein
VRLVFQYDGRHVQLLSQSPVTMVVPHANPGQAAPGIYVDSRSVDDVPLARVRAYRAMAPSAEVFPARAGERPHHVARSQRGAFSVVVPVPQAADHVTLVRIAHGTAAPSDAAARTLTAHDGAPAMATDLARFPLGKAGP